MRPLLFALSTVALLPAATPDFDFFEAKIRPVLAARCYGCHSAKLKQAEGGLYLDSLEATRKGGRSGVPAVVPGKPQESLLIKVIQGTHKDLKMPPGNPLPKDQVANFVAWVEMGAPDPRTGGAVAAAKPAYDWEKEKKHWAYQPLRAAAPPAIADPEWNQNPIDRFLKARLDEKQIKPLPRASKLTLLRRATYDLTGLPPTPQETAAFLADPSPQAFPKLLDRLLASPAYGEHWGRRWLDVVRYADTAGDASDYPVPEMYRFRNYVIRSFQQDKPFNDFLREQIAGDILPHLNEEDRRDKLIATGYLANARRFGQTEGEFYLTIDDTIDNLGKVALGLTVGCARCHDHKFDPIPTADYYALAGIFNSSKYAWAGLEHHQYLDGFAALEPKDSERLRKQQERMVNAYRTVKKGEGKDPKSPTPQRLAFLEAQAELLQIRGSWPDLPMAYAVAEATPVNARIMVKGDPATLGPEVPRGFLTILGGQQVPPAHPGSGRDLLASWITDPANPLTARVLANRVWTWHFGRGIVNTPNDFGARGEKPTHPELLDHLAATLLSNGWSLKQLHKQILLSRAWQGASGHLEANAVKDPKNETYWRFDRRRLTAEEIRDSMLLASGNLDPVPGGPHPFAPRASYIQTQHRPFVADPAAFDHNKRSVYLFQQRFRPHAYLDLFDGADANAATAVRAANNTATQALYLMNNEFVQKQADALAVRVGMAEPTTAGRIRLAHQLLFHRAPSPAEQQMAARFLAQTTGQLEARASWTSYMRVLLSSNEFFFVD
ncbi:MAG: PSD1 and planctomycete cytochrome C domain-containing protein [Acidobacteria bacterium]|jgi:hypothetical protein|nr:PSD1 and planctomycete cytochrome C domain-containing protein [Bryobacteraceae bacterium CoA2 C42]